MLQTGVAGLGDQLLGVSAPGYERHRPEQTLLYQIVDKHYPDFLAQLAAEGKSLPDHVQQEFTVSMTMASALEDGEWFTTTELTTRMFRRMQAGVIRIEGRLVNRGRTTGFVEADFFQENGKLAARASAAKAIRARSELS
jgi:hypothetical protein